MDQTKGLKTLTPAIWGSDGCASPPISSGGIRDLRKLILRTLNDNQLLVLNAVAENETRLTSLLHRLSKEYGIPLSTLKLNARILRDLNLISYGSIHNKRNARLESLGKLVLKIVRDNPVAASIMFAD